MSFETIQIFRDYSIINGFVQVPPNREGERTAYTPDEFLVAMPTGEVQRLAHPNTNPTTGRHFGSQEFIRVPGQTFAVDL